MKSESSTSSPSSTIILSPRGTVNNTENLDDIVRKQKQCMFWFSCVFKLILSSALIVWIIYSIIALSGENFKDIKDKCPKSTLWPCLCTMVGVSILNIFLESRPKNNQESKPNVLGFCLILAAFIWMSIELFDTCATEKLSDYKIYYMLYILYWIYVGVFSMFIIGIICICCGIDGRDLTNNNEQRNTEFSNDVLDV